MSVYYNENDLFCVEWLKNLMLCDLIPYGEVDARSITEVKAEDVRGFTHCHFFAGIGGWAYALALAGWDVRTPAWTGSAPCQPFSQAGKRKGVEDARHLWPEFNRLIGQCRPSTVFGEQVASAKFWLDMVCDDLEGQGYACGAAVLPACSVGAPHRRDRFWFVADSTSARSLSGALRGVCEEEAGARSRDVQLKRFRGARTSRTMADAKVEPERKSAEEEDNALSSVRKTRAIFSGDGEFMADTHSIPAFGSSIARQERDTWGIEPSVGRVVTGIPHKLVEPILRGFGNAIVPQVAAEFVKAFMECMP